MKKHCENCEHIYGLTETTCEECKDKSNYKQRERDFNKLKGKAELNYRKLDNGTTEYNVYDENHFICGTLGCNKEKLEEMIKRSNEYEVLNQLYNNAIKIAESRLKQYRELEKELQKEKNRVAILLHNQDKNQSVIRELIEQLEIIKSTYEMGYVLNDTIIKDIEKVLKKIEGLDSIESKVSIDYHSKICSNCQYYYQGCKKNINSNNTICDKFKAFPF